MSRRRILPDPFRFAADHRRESGVLPQQELARTQDLLVSAPEQAVAWTLSGWQDEEGGAFFSLRITGSLSLLCQRCLSGVQWEFDKTTVMRLVRPDTPVSDEELEEDAFDTLEAMFDLDVLALVEDEVLLSMPVAPRHEHCRAPVSTGPAQDDSPFAVLAKLRGKRPD